MTDWIVEQSDARREVSSPLVRPACGMTMAEMALRFICTHKTVGTVIPGMRKARHVAMNTSVSDGQGLPGEVYEELRKHRWDRVPTSWSQ